MCLPYICIYLRIDTPTHIDETKQILPGSILRKLDGPDKVNISMFAIASAWYSMSTNSIMKTSTV